MSLKAEIDRGLVLDLNFENKEQLKKLGATVYGDPVVHYGVEGDGVGKYVTVRGLTSEFASDDLSIAVTFTPNISPTSDVDQFIAGNDSGTLYIRKRDNAGSNQLRVIVFGVTATISQASYENYWRVGERNVLHAVTDATAGSLTIYLNGSQIGSFSSSISHVDYNHINICSYTSGGSNYFDGTVTRFQVFHAVLELQEHIDAYHQTTYNYMQDSLVHLPMDAERHDPTNSKTLDVSGNFNDGTLEATVEKLPTRGYYLPGGSSYIDLTGVVSSGNAWGVAFTCRLKSVTSITHRLFDIQSGRRSVFVVDGQLSIYDGIFNYCGCYVKANEVFSCTLVGDTDGTSKLFLNGFLAYTLAGTPVPISGGFRFGATYTGGFSQSMDIFEALPIDKALTQTQAADLHNRLMEGVQNV